MIYTLSKELEQELIVSAPELQASYTAIVEYLEAINQKKHLEAILRNSRTSLLFS